MYADIEENIAVQAEAQKSGMAKLKEKFDEANENFSGKLKVGNCQSWKWQSSKNYWRAS